MKLGCLILLSVCMSFLSQAQVLTAEDSLAAGLVSGTQKTMISGYGEARASVDIKQKDALANLDRVVLFVGHKFNQRISLFSELEIEDAMVVGGIEEGEGKGEISMEQAFLKFDVNPTNYFVAGLFIPRIGIINENHLPTTFNGVQRPFVEQLVIPATWRAIGIAYYGSLQKVSGLNYSFSLMNGLNSQQFSNGSGIREGVQAGSNARGQGIMLHGSLLYYLNDIRLQASSTFSGTTALEQRIADSLQLKSGLLANPLFLNECNVQYRKNGLELKALLCWLHISGAEQINRAFANNTPSTMMGAYAELGYDLLSQHPKYSNRNLILFTRAEYINLNQQIAVNGISNDANRKMFFLAGATYKPIKGVAIKFDYTQRITGKQNEDLVVTPFPQSLPYYTNKGFLNVGLAYNF